METAEAKTVHEIIFIVQSSGLIITISPVTKEQYTATGRSEKSAVAWIKNKKKRRMKCFFFPAAWAP